MRMSLNADMDHMYEEFMFDDIIYRIDEWVEDSDEEDNVRYALEDFEEQILKPTSTPMKDWKSWSEEQKIIFVDWIQSKKDDNYGFNKWLNHAWEHWCASLGDRDDEGD